MRILIDSELLVLLIVGLHDPGKIAQHANLGGRRDAYAEADFDRLTLFLSGKDLLVTPNVMSETSNLLRQIGDPGRTDLTVQLRRFAERTRERFTPSAVAAERREFDWLGLPDAATLASLDAETVLLTADGPLCAAAHKANLTVIHLAELGA